VLTVHSKASVKLLFCTPSNSKVVVTRNLQLDQNKDKLSIKTLDSTIEITKANGEKASQSSKCSEIDKQVPMLMGVSKSILEMVIFCHQEESNWPLTGTDAELKKRFDLIFSADRYRKGLAELKDQQKALTARVKVLCFCFSFFCCPQILVHRCWSLKCR
jgi:DNA repair protein RAD50